MNLLSAAAKEMRGLSRRVVVLLEEKAQLDVDLREAKRRVSILAAGFCARGKAASTWTNDDRYRIAAAQELLR